jgi:hypothetical protein
MSDRTIPLSVPGTTETRGITEDLWAFSDIITPREDSDLQDIRTSDTSR